MFVSSYQSIYLSVCIVSVCLSACVYAHKRVCLCTVNDMNGSPFWEDFAVRIVDQADERVSVQ